MANEIRFGDRLRLKHVNSGVCLHSHPIKYSHSLSSKQQQVTGYALHDDNDFWVVKSAHGTLRDSAIEGTVVQHLDTIRLTHFQTGRNLHSHTGFFSPVTNNQEVTAFGSDGLGDGNDNWVVHVLGPPRNPRSWRLNDQVRLVHGKFIANTNLIEGSNAALCSEAGMSHAVETQGQQEVSARNEPADLSFWQVTEKAFAGLPPLAKYGAFVAGFRPSTSALRFANSFPNVPFLTAPFFAALGINPATLPFNAAGNGICGGMIFTTRDYFETGFPLPQIPDRPPQGSPLFNRITTRLLASFNISTLRFMRYMDFMDGHTPIREPSAPSLPQHHCRAYMILHEEWPNIKASIDSGNLCCLGLVMVRTDNVADLGRNHQVLAYGYEIDGDQLCLHIYDPDLPLDDHVRLTMNIADDSQDFEINYTRAGGLSVPHGIRRVHGFFENRFDRLDPELLPTTPAAKVHLKASNHKYLAAENGGGGDLHADRAVAADWETFFIEKTDAAPLAHNDMVYLRTHDGHFLSAKDSGGGLVRANGPQPRPWERFQIKSLDGVSPLHDANLIYLRAYNSQYVGLAANEIDVHADQDAAGPTEIFRMEIVP